MRLPGTLSARIILGFAVLIVTYGAISANTMFNMDRLYAEVRALRLGYLRISQKSSHLAERQEALVEYLTEDLEGYLRDDPAAGTDKAIRPSSVARKIRSLQAARAKLLAEIEEVIANPADLPRVHRKKLAATATQLSKLREMIAASAVHYERLLAVPPIQPSGADRPAFVRQRQQGAESLEWLRKQEKAINAKVDGLHAESDRLLTRTARWLEDGSRELRWLTIAFGAGAAVIGLAVILMAALTLRPLRRLRLAAQQIAQGDYASRIPVKGPPEVADLARDLNAMGAAVEERERELVRRERLAVVGKMAAAITHEVRNPLSSISLNTELLEDELSELPEDGTREAKNLCRAIGTEVDRLTEITETYLQFARLPKPRKQSEGLDVIVQNLTDFEREQLSLRGVALEVRLAPDLPRVMIDDGQLRQALLNLLRNAADAVEEIGGGHVSVTTRRGAAADTVEIAVEDDGPGIAEGLVPKLFEPFFSTKDGGTGLGLALSHQIVKEHEGSIRVESRPGHGATFVISLPVSGDDPSPDP